MASSKDPDPDCPEFVEVDPTGRYGRYNEILGKGASKIVYRAFDEYEGIEVAWNQVKLYDFLQSPEDLERLYCEIHLLKTLKHKNIMKFYTSWVDTSKRNINFITEMFTSGTLRQYRQRHRRVNIRAVKHWCRQILSGLLYLHSHDPPIIHRDLKCDNIFVNGNQGQVKIGDLGLAAILRKSHAVHCVGTPEFMAPEVYEEEYNELVDIYSFGMCLIEMVTFEYPYSECTNPAQIYKKVISGTKPDALYRVKDTEVRKFIEKCLVTASKRLSARELLKDPFLQTDDLGLSSWEEDDLNSTEHILRQPYLIQAQSNGSLITNTFTENQFDGMEFENGWGYDSTEIEAIGMDLFDRHDEEHLANTDISIKGRRMDDGNVFLWLRIADGDGRVRNINFIFDVEADTALSVATEMVAELDITEYEVTRIADIIDGEVALLVPGWKRGPRIEELPGVQTATVCKNCASNVSSCGSLLDYLSLKNPGRSHCCPHLESAEMHGRFEEITYQVEESERCGTEGEPTLSTSQSDELDFRSLASRGIQSDEWEQLDQSGEDGKATQRKGHMRSCSTMSSSQLFLRSQQQIISELSELRNHVPAGNDNGSDIHEELRLLKAKCRMELQEYSKQQLQGSKGFLHDSPAVENEEFGLHDGISRSSAVKASQPFNGMESFHLGRRNSFIIPESDADSSTSGKAPVDTDSRHCSSGRPDFQVQRGRNCEADAVVSHEMMCKAQNFYVGAVLPSSLPRTKSLPVDVGNM